MLELFELSSNSVRRNEGSERGRIYFRGGRAAAKEKILKGTRKPRKTYLWDVAAATPWSSDVLPD